MNVKLGALRKKGSVYSSVSFPTMTQKTVEVSIPERLQPQSALLLANFELFLSEICLHNWRGIVIPRGSDVWCLHLKLSDESVIFGFESSPIKGKDDEIVLVDTAAPYMWIHGSMRLIHRAKEILTSFMKRREEDLDKSEIEDENERKRKKKRKELRTTKLDHLFSDSNELDA